MVLVGFFVNRCLAPFMVEVTALVQEGVDLPSMDKAMRAFGMPVGPITLSGTIILPFPPSPPYNVILHEQLLRFCLFTLLSESMTIFFTISRVLLVILSIALLSFYVTHSMP